MDGSILYHGGTESRMVVCAGHLLADGRPLGAQHHGCYTRPCLAGTIGHGNSAAHVTGLPTPSLAVGLGSSAYTRIRSLWNCHAQRILRL